MSGEPRPPRGSAVGVVAGSAVAALAVAALVGVLILAFGERAERTDRAVAAEVRLEQLTPEPTRSSEATEPPATRNPEASGGERAAVVVFNQTARVGLAAAFRDRLREAGWKVPAVDDFVGTVPATTVYFPPGLRSAARTLMAEFPDVGRIRPAFDGIPTDRLTVILAKDFP